MDPKDIPQIKYTPEANSSDSVLVSKMGSDQEKEDHSYKQPVFPGMKINFRKSLIIALAILAVFVIAIGLPGILVYRQALILSSSINKLDTSAKSKDINQIKSALADTKSSLSRFRSSLMLIAWTQYVPFVGGYMSDAIHATNGAQAGLDAGEIVINTIEPYSDFLGLKGATKDTSQRDGVKTAQERIDFVVKAIPDLLPKMDVISQKVKVLRSEVDMVNSDRYPEKYQGREVRSRIKQAQQLVDEASVFFVNGKPLLGAAPYLLGIDGARKYLILFQNDKELRPTGGFMTAYATMDVNKAHFEPTSSNDIYNLDAQYTPQVPAPAPLVKYIKGPYIISQNLRLRDMNWSPDFATSMKLFTDSVKLVGVRDFDGIIAVDTQLLVNLLNAIGPIGVPGFGNFSTKIDTECNCAQVIHELESFADVEGPIVWDPNTGKIVYRPPNSDNRKRIIGPLMNSILANAMGQPKDKLPALFEAGFKSLTEKHVLFYLFDQKAQSAVRDFGIAGSIVDFSGGDYLHINDANLGGRKSNLYVTQEVNQEVNVGSEGQVEKTVTITYKNPAKQDGWLNSVLPNWVRIYVPKGSKLIAQEGFEDKADPYEELDKTVFAGFFRLRPEGVSKITLKYQLPIKFSKDYKLLIQKQPGTDAPLYTIKVGRHQDEFYLKSDKELHISI